MDFFDSYEEEAMEDDQLDIFFETNSEHEILPQVPNGEPDSNDLGQHIPDIDGDIQDWTFNIQSMWDEFRAPLIMQDRMMKMLFSGVQPTKGRRPALKRERASLASLLLNNEKKKITKPIAQNLEQLFCRYRSMGMVEPKRWRLCVGSKDFKHQPKVFSPKPCVCPLFANDSSKWRFDCGRCSMPCEECGNLRKQMIPFDYISFVEQLKLLCKSSTNCHEFLAMWRERSKWLGHNNNEEPKNVKEVWDGEKVRMLQDFWNPNAQWELPVVCSNEKCKRIYRCFPHTMKSKELIAGWNAEKKEYGFRCTKCYHWIQRKQETVKGDPRNFALICHWDGFQAASTKQKDVGVVELSIANANKGNQLGPLPLLFMPFSLVQLEKKNGDLLHYFLTPVIDELISSFLDGFMLNYCYPPEVIAEGLLNDDKGCCRLRAMLMFWTGDHPAQCKLGLFKDGGKNGCRRDYAITSRVEQQGRIPFYVYDKNRYQGRYPAQKRKVEDLYEAIRASKRESSKKRKEGILGDAGLTGESGLWKLHELYGFDISKDLVYDVMHIFALNLFKKYTKALVESSDNQQKRFIDASTKEATFAVPTSLRHQGRWPSSSPSQHHNMFTAEEHQKFVMWCLPHVLNTVTSISTELKNLGKLLIDLAHIFYNYTRSHGWSKEELEVTRTLLLSWRVLSEEYHGPNASPLEHVAGNAEMLDDIRRHGGHDGMWCYGNERAVSGYVAIPTNNKANELTYAHYQSRTLLTKTMKNMKMEEDGLQPNERLSLLFHACLQKLEGSQFSGALGISCQEWHTQGIFIAASEKIAMNLFKVCELVDPSPCKQLLKTKGVLVGPQRTKFRPLDGCEREYLQMYWRNVGLTNEAVSFVKIFLKGEKYKVQDRAIVSCSQEEGYCLCEINDFFSHQNHGSIEVFFAGSFANNGASLNNLPKNEVTGMKVISAFQLANKCIKIMPISYIRHRCFLLPSGRNGDHVIYEMQDLEVRKSLIQLGEPGCFPPWLEKGDMVQANIHDDLSNLEVAMVHDVCHESREVKLAIMSHLTGEEWEVVREEDIWRGWNVCLKILSHQ